MVVEAKAVRKKGDWIPELKNILHLGPGAQLDFGENPKAQHRSTKAAVKLLLSNLRKGAKKIQNQDSSADDIEKVVFNAVDSLIRDKVLKSDDKTQFDALKKFEEILNEEFKAEAKKKDGLDNSWKVKINGSVRALRQEALEQIVHGDKFAADDAEQYLQAMTTTDEGKHALTSNPVLVGRLMGRLDPSTIEKFDFNTVFGKGQSEVLSESLEAITALFENDDKYKKENMSFAAFDSLAKNMLLMDETKKALLKKPKLLGSILSSLVPQTLQNFDFDAAFGKDKNEILGEAVLATSDKQPHSSGFASNRHLERDPELFKMFQQELLKSNDWKKIGKRKPAVGGAILSSFDSATLQNFDYDKEFGDSKNAVLAEALKSISRKTPPKINTNIDRFNQFDAASFTQLKSKVDKKVWNDQTPTAGPLQGLGPRVCQSLWKNGNYDQIVELINHGVDTSVPARVQGGEGTGRAAGVHSGFVQPIQHVASKCLRDVGLLNKNDKSLNGKRKQEAEGAKKIFAALGDKAETLGDWDAVEKCDMIKEFKKKPGTIWGFEDIRLPFVQAAHATDHGLQPLRMLELWEAVEESLSDEAYAKLLADPKKYSKELVQLGVDKIQSGLTTGDPVIKAKYDEIRRDSAKYIENFKKSAEKFLLEFAAQMPKGLYSGKGNGDEPLPEVTGLLRDKRMGGLACKAGLWWAKEEGKPLYYCLDGIKMDDVTNYKKVKNKAVADFMQGDGKGHDEVITMVELREVLKNWRELKDTVVFVEKGKILKGEELNKKVVEWQKNMAEANKQAGRTPAPDRAVFAKRLNAIDPGLVAKLDKVKDPATANMDARDIVKKHGYLIKVANTRPRAMLKYIVGKCDVLIKYELVPRDLPDNAALVYVASKNELASASEKMRKSIKKCHADYQQPLETVLNSYKLTA